MDTFTTRTIDGSIIKMRLDDHRIEFGNNFCWILRLPIKHVRPCFELFHLLSLCRNLREAEAAINHVAGSLKRFWLVNVRTAFWYAVPTA